MKILCHRKPCLVLLRSTKCAKIEYLLCYLVRNASFLAENLRYRCAVLVYDFVGLLKHHDQQDGRANRLWIIYIRKFAYAVIVLFDGAANAAVGSVFIEFYYVCQIRLWIASQDFVNILDSCEWTFVSDSITLLHVFVVVGSV